MKKCIGCGSVLQINHPNQSGFAKSLDNQYCLRCFRVKNYNDLIEQEINQKDFIKNIDEVLKNDPTAIFYYVVDIFDLKGSRMLDLEKKIKNHQVVIVGNKIDLMPKSVKLSKLRRHVEKEFQNSHLADTKILLATAFKPNFVEPILNLLLKNSANQYFIGSSNVGKSSLINAIMKANNLIPTVVVSRYFNTTLAFIEIKLNSETKLIDTPGIARNNSLALLTNKEDWEYFYFKRELKQYGYQLQPNQALVFGAVLWLEFDLKQQTNFHVYSNPMIDIHRTKAINALNYLTKNYSIIKPRVANLSQNVYEIEFVFEKQFIGQEYDILLSGLGWINFIVQDEMKISVLIPTKDTNFDLEEMVHLRAAII